MRGIGSRSSASNVAWMRAVSALGGRATLVSVAWSYVLLHVCTNSQPCDTSTGYTLALRSCAEAKAQAVACLWTCTGRGARVRPENSMNSPRRTHSRTHSRMSTPERGVRIETKFVRARPLCRSTRVQSKQPQPAKVTENHTHACVAHLSFFRPFHLISRAECACARRPWRTWSPRRSCSCRRRRASSSGCS